VIGLDDNIALGELILLLSEFELEAADPAVFVLLNIAQNIKLYLSFGVGYDSRI
jgi:hypothetical protein